MTVINKVRTFDLLSCVDKEEYEEILNDPRVVVLSKKDFCGTTLLGEHGGSEFHIYRVVEYRICESVDDIVSDNVL